MANENNIISRTNSEDQEHRNIVLRFGFLISSITAICLDVLFFYMYYIDDQKKCFAVDKKDQESGARSVTDFILLLEVAYKVCSSSILELCPNSKMNANAPLTFFGRLADVSKRVPWMNVLVDFLALLPFPQVLLQYFM
ncbi:cyclic nucleotide-gated ion channel 1-like [Cucumis melo]|uniref:Cyclic nucleotide-gated ion channel 1-like n=1 Tax=Cucumis melo TaxID=3656 RepID=A0ABM3KYR9_CUCME|nr:cyclic nucleotide-gated ion channel 1-like [Cucumis melo]